LLTSGRTLRAFGFGFSGVLIAVHLQARALSATEIGLFLSIALTSASLAGLIAATAAGRFGRRLTLVAIGVLMLICGIDMSLSTQAWLLIAGGATGMAGVAGTDLGPFLPIEQAVLAQSSDPPKLNRSFARYSLSGGLGGAVGAFAAALGTSLERREAFFVAFALLGAATAIVPLFLSDAVEANRELPVFGSLRPLIGLSALFGLDSLGGGLVVNAVVVYWLHIRFGASPSILGPSFAVMSVLGAASFELSGRLADRIGLVNTMVFTHLPSNVALFLVPFAPSLPIAIAILILRSTLVQMDQPARQAYVVSIVKPNERSGALAITGALRGVANGAGPLITGAAIQAASLGLPFFLGVTLKSLYDVGLYFGYRRRLGGHELERHG